MTKRELFNATINVLNVVDLADLGIELAEGESKQTLIDGLLHEIDLLDKKKTSGTRKPTQTQLDNLVHVETIRDILANTSEPMSIKQIKAMSESLSDFSSSKMVQLLKKVGVEKTYIKKVVHYTLV